MAEFSNVEVRVGDETVTIKRSGKSKLVVAKVLGEDKDGAGKRRLYLDRIVHRPSETKLGPWEVSGAISTILTQ